LAAPQISVVLIVVYATQSLVVYVAITACPSAETEISLGFIVVFKPREISGSAEGQAVIATYTTKD
jgi:hypothetical protein